MMMMMMMDELLSCHKVQGTASLQGHVTVRCVTQ